VDKLQDGAADVVDILGEPGFRVGGLAIHISGFSPFGQKTGLGWICAIGAYSVDWLGARDTPSGLGCRGPEAAAIVSGTKPNWDHHSMFSGCSYFLTLEGIYKWAAGLGDAFSPLDVIDGANSRRGDKWPLDKHHVAVARRLLEGSIDVSNNQIVSDDGKIGVVRLVRVGRWSYMWIRRAQP